MRRLTILLLLTFCLLFAANAGADFWPDSLSSLGKMDTHSPTLPKTKKFDASLAKTLAPAAKYDPWPATPPQIGRLVLKQEYWNYMKEAARKYQISPYLIEAVCAIESRFDPNALIGARPMLRPDAVALWYGQEVRGGLTQSPGEYHGGGRGFVESANQI